MFFNHINMSDYLYFVYKNGSVIKKFSWADDLKKWAFNILSNNEFKDSALFDYSVQYLDNKIVALTKHMIIN